MRGFIDELRDIVTFGVVGGSDFEKQKEQLGDDGKPLFLTFLFFFVSM